MSTNVAKLGIGADLSKETKKKKEKKVKAEKKDRDIYFKNGSLYVSRFTVYYIILATMFIAVGVATNQVLFKGVLLADGFYVQVMTVKNAVGFAGVNWIHYLRYLAVSPFLWVEETGGAKSLLQTTIMLILMTPVLFARMNQGRRSVLQLFLMFLPFALSFRTVMAMLSIIYLFLYVFTDRNKNLFLLLYYGLFSFLSSGVFLNWFILVPLVYQRSAPKVKKVVGVFSIFVGFGFVTALGMKADFFTSEGALDSIGGEAGGGGGGAVVNALLRSNIATSYIVGAYDEFVTYTILLIATFAVMIITMVENKLVLVYFFFPLLTSFVFEGLGTMAYLLTLAYYGLYKDVIEPHPPVDPYAEIDLLLKKREALGIPTRTRTRTGGI